MPEQISLGHPEKQLFWSRTYLENMYTLTWRNHKKKFCVEHKNVYPPAMNAANAVGDDSLLGITNSQIKTGFHYTCQELFAKQAIFETGLSWSFPRTSAFAVVIVPLCLISLLSSTSIITLVRHKNARFDTKIHSSTQKMPGYITCQWRHQTPPFLWEMFFQFYSNIREIKIQLYSMSLWNKKFNHSFLSVMIIMSSAIKKCYWFGIFILQLLRFILIASSKYDMHIAILVQ